MDYFISKSCGLPFYQSFWRQIRDSASITPAASESTHLYPREIHKIDTTFCTVSVRKISRHENIPTLGPFIDMKSTFDKTTFESIGNAL